MTSHGCIAAWKSASVDKLLPDKRLSPERWPGGNERTRS
jgi:hypothetical protein